MGDLEWSFPFKYIIDVCIHSDGSMYVCAKYSSATSLIYYFSCVYFLLLLGGLKSWKSKEEKKVKKRKEPATHKNTRN